MKKLLAVVALLYMVLPVSADDTALRGVGGAVAPMEKHPSIQMVRERVDVRLNWDRAYVRCEFEFKNHGPATRVKIGFPERGYPGPLNGGDLQDFVSWVDGQLIDTALIPSAEDLGEFDGYRAWHVKEVDFAANQTRMIVNEYNSLLGADSLGHSRFFQYVLETGKTWKGNIQEAVIDVDISEISDFWRIAGVSPDSADVTESSITWRLTDFEPEENIHVRMEVRRMVYVDGFPAQYDPDMSSRRGITVSQVADLQMVAGCRVAWNAQGRECVVTYGDNSLRLYPGRRAAILNTKDEVELPAAPYLKDSRLFVPIVAVAEVVGLEVTYLQGLRLDEESSATPDEETRYIRISSDEDRG